MVALTKESADAINAINKAIWKRARLEREIVAAAKAWNATNHRDTQACEQRLAELGDAVDRLVEFESLQEKKG